jgi:tetratricopeptide (TPR) repeat protein
MRNIGIALIIIIIAILAFFSFADWNFVKPPAVIDEEASEEIIDIRDQAGDMNRAEQALRRGQAENAQEIAERYVDVIESQTPAGKRWGNILVQAAAETHDIGQLQVLYHFSPSLFRDQEKASLLVAESLIASGDIEAFTQLRNRWVGNESNATAWTILDSDRLLLEGDRQGANDLLGSHTFTGTAEIDRLMRLALINVSDDPKTAWRYFTRAEAKDPQNPEIHFYKGKLLESVGKFRNAQMEYEAAVATDPNNQLMQDQLAEFYLRQHQPRKAIDLWTSNLEETSVDFVWLKGLFWSKVMLPAKVEWTKLTPPQGKLQPLLAYLGKLKPGTYWNKDRFAKVPNKDEYLDEIEMTYWLRTFEALRTGDAKEAVAIQNESKFTRTNLNQDLEFALKQILSYQTTGEFDKSNPPRNLGTGDDKHPFILQLEALATSRKPEVSEEMNALLTSKEAYSAALLAAGWNEAAIQLHQVAIYPENFPVWVAVDMTYAIKQNRNSREALDFAAMQNETAPLQLTVAEMKVAEGDEAGALEALQPIVAMDNELGFKAAWMASLIYLEQHQPHKAKEVIYGQPLLFNDVKGKETLARVVIMEGNKPLAAEIYEKISEVSEEAKSYLARQAFLQADWEKAKRLTRQLLKLHPNNAQLQQNLERIISEQNKALNQ